MVGGEVRDGVLDARFGVLVPKGAKELAGKADLQLLLDPRHLFGRPPLERRDAADGVVAPHEIRQLFGARGAPSPHVGVEGLHLARRRRGPIGHHDHPCLAA